MIDGLEYNNKTSDESFNLIKKELNSLRKEKYEKFFLNNFLPNSLIDKNKNLKPILGNPNLNLNYNNPKNANFPNPILYNPLLLHLKNQPPNTLNLEPSEKITADNIAEFAFPVAQFIQEVQPDFVYACDRGARLFGVAVKMMYHELYGKFPTIDGKLNFRKLSRKISPDTMRTTLERDIKTMLEQTESPTVLFLDDWVSTGGTKEMIERMVNELSGGKITVLYGVMRGAKADVSGSLSSHAHAEWSDRPEIIGVDYNSQLTGRSVRSPRAREYRKRMSENIRDFVLSLKGPPQQKPEPLYTSY